MVLATTPLGARLIGADSDPVTPAADAARTTPVGIRSIPHDNDDRVNLAPGYAASVVARWGDPVVPGAPPFNPMAQTADAAARQFGFNCDYIGFLPLYPGADDRGLLFVNHEYTSGGDMFPDYNHDHPMPEQIDIEIMSHGASIIEVAKAADGSWSYRPNSRFNRRITGETEMLATGPAAGSIFLQTAADPFGAIVSGMFNNCAGGRTPWGTILTCEENFDQYFANNAQVPQPARANNDRYGVPAESSQRKWETTHPRFDLARHANEVNRFGYVVEIDPYDPDSTPRKHTAMGRFKHEGANVTLADDNRVVVYSGDDQRFDYVYKFVSYDRFDPFDREANMRLLESGTLYVARFDDHGGGEWIPLVPRGPLANWSPAQISVFTRVAADLVGATPMDRPEDIEVNPVNRRVYIALTNNTRRASDATDAANPRGPNVHGHILELTETGGDSGALRFTWDIFILCGDPANPDDQTYFAGFDQSQLDSISAPDNFAFDNGGNLWIATDGQPSKLGTADAVYVVPTAGPDRGHIRRFLTGVPQAEVAGPEFSRDYETLFVSIQHPGDGGGLINNSVSRFPDGDYPRPSVVAAHKVGGGRIGT